MSDPPPSPPPQGQADPPSLKGGFLGWFLLVSGAIVLFLTLGCVVALAGGNPLAGLIFGSPTLLLGGLLVWLGTRRFNR
jgi:hypothetical protein